MTDGGDASGGGRILDLTRRIRTGARRALGSTASPAAETVALEPAEVTRSLLPVRYQIRESEDSRHLICSEASNISVRVERGISVASSAARKAPRGTIYLDGAAQAEPFMDAAKKVFNLDHHEGCVRAFTLATCEQAMVLVLKGLDLDDEQWTVWVNEPDFDAVLALWLLLNHRRLTGNSGGARDRITPLVRLQGVIDAHGLDLVDLTGFPDELQQRTLETIESVRVRELELKSEGEWSSTDLLDYTRATLARLDEVVYSSKDFEDHSVLEELGRVRLTPRRLAIACRADVGIYEVEEQLREIHGDRLGVVILQKDAATYTVRQSDPFLSADLHEAYDRLNLLDPAATADQRWGGSGDIGGSPRGAGTALSLPEILAAFHWVFHPPSSWRRLAAVASAAAIVSGAMTAALLLSPTLTGWSVPGLLTGSGGVADGLAAATLAVIGLVLGLWSRRRRSGLFGWRLPRQLHFMVLLPAAAGLAAAGGGWLVTSGPALGGERGYSSMEQLVVVLAGAVGVELIVHGAAHGVMVAVYSVMLRSGRWFISVPNAVTAVLYTAAVVICLRPPAWAAPGWVGSLAWATAALLFALVCGIARERWESVWAAVLLHLAAVAAVWTGLTLL